MAFAGEWQRQLLFRIVIAAVEHDGKMLAEVHDQLAISSEGLHKRRNKHRCADANIMERRNKLGCKGANA